MRKQRRWNWGKDRDRYHIQSGTCCSFSGQGVIPLDKLERQREQPALHGWHTLRLGPGSKAEQLCKVSQSATAYQHRKKDFTHVGTHPPHPPMARQAVKSHLADQKRTEKNISSLNKWFVLIAGKPTGENRAVDMPTCFHLPPSSHPLWGGLVETAG